MSGVGWRTAPIAEWPIEIIDGDRSSNYPKASDIVDHGVPFLNTTNIRDGVLDLTDLRYITEQKAATIKKGRLRQNDIIMTTRGTIGRVARFRCEHRSGVINAQMLILRTDPGTLNADLLYYVLGSEDVQRMLRSFASGSAQPQIPIRDLRCVPITLPPLESQRRIASILGAYDDLIEVNRRRITVLEEMARGLFEEWFVRFRFPGHEAVPILDTPGGPLPEGWRHAVLGDLVEQRRDTTSAGEHLNERAYVPIECIARRSLALDDLRPWQEAQSSLQLFATGDILFGAMRAYFHKVAPAPLDGVTRSTCFVLRPRSPSLAAYSLQTLFRDETIAYATAHSKGSTIPYAQWAGVLERMPCLLPDAQTLQHFQSLIQPMVDLIVSIWFQARNLAAARDLLLPPLISGQLSVASAERELEAA